MSAIDPMELREYVANRIREHRYSDDPVVCEVVRAFNQIYYGVSQASQPWARNQWRGVPILKCPEDLFIYQEIIERVRPEVIVECGVAYGGSTLFLADMCKLICGTARGLIGIDVTLENVAPSTRSSLNIAGVTLISGSSTDPAVVDQVRQIVDHRGGPVLVILDSDHSAPHVSRELELYAPCVTRGSYVIVEDTNISGNPVGDVIDDGGPARAVDTFLAATPAFQRDVDAERLMVTFNPGGYLLRVK